MIVQIFRRHATMLSQRPFARLVRHCINRMFYGGEFSDAGELNFGIGAVLALLALPGAFVSIFMSDKYGSLLRFLHGQPTHFDTYTASLPDEYFFIVLSMAAAGSVAVWKWDSLLPDRRDYANLAPLPIPSRNIFGANLLALLLLAGVLSIDINGVSSVLFPLIACGSSESVAYVAVFFESHLFSVVLAGAFSFLAVLANLGILMTLVPYRAFRRVSVYARCAMLIFFMALLTTAIYVPRKIQRMPHLAGSWIKLAPSAWFLGLCQSLRGRGDPLFSALATAALVGSACALAFAIAAYALSYHRCFVRSAETIASPSASRSPIVAMILRLLDKTILRTPFQRAGYRFTMKTLFRSESHTMTWGGFAAMGIILAAQILLLPVTRNALRAHAVPSADLLSVPFVISYFLTVGLRLAFEIPAPLRANWLFQLGVDPHTHECAPLARRIILTFEIPALAVLWGAYAHYWGWRVSAIHIAIVAVSSVLLMETLLLGFRKIPFTCSAPSFKSSTTVLILVCILGFFAFTQIIAKIEQQAFGDPFPGAIFLAVLLGLWSLGLHQWRNNIVGSDSSVLFEDTQRPAVEILDLTFRR